MQYSAILLAAFLWTACQGPEGPMGPASSPKTAAEQAADTTGCEVVINITGENIIYEGDNPDTMTVTVYDTVMVDTSGNALGDQFAFLRVTLFSSDYRNGGWTIDSDTISESTVKAVYYQRNREVNVDDMEGYNWMEFDAWADLFTPSFQTQPSYSVSDGELVISDPDRVIFFGYIAILLG